MSGEAPSPVRAGRSGTGPRRPSPVGFVRVTAAGADFEEVRSAALRIARCLIDAGHETYFAGGCVRDRLFGFTPTDIDIATAATPDAVRAIFPRARGVGASFGVMLVPNDGCSI
ncbi:MAG: CCA tRNA nucleotidyltransferase, partial [Phycisphaeraceae bacterium]|nr:CCA tRNA nucleotidyltransferase [Phycisphaeraceae bacterium]